MIKVLSIGYLPKEIGGSYTTGIANVVYELSKPNVEGLKLFTFATNITDSTAKKISKYEDQYIGYEKSVFKLSLGIIKNIFHVLSDWSVYKNVSKLSPIRGEFYRQNIRRAIKLTKPDIIHVHGCDLASVKFASRGFDIPIILTSHGLYCCQGKDDIAGQTKARALVKYADYVTALTNEVKSYLTSILNVQQENIPVIPNGVDTTRFFFDSNVRETLRNEHNIPEGRAVFATVASIYPLKGQLEFVKYLEGMNFDYEYWIFGNGSQKQEIIDYCNEHNLTDKVKMMGYLNNNEVYKYLSAADVYAHVSHSEGQALCELEAYATGIRTVLCNEIVGTVATDPYNKENYFVIDLNKPDENGLAQWLKSNNANNRTSRTNLDWSKVVNMYKTYYLEVWAAKESLK